ncbi:hypothetical protein A33O_04120 [Nitratireductor aquibiodomus RA22]|uniref:Uncharacterized protein n=1 Tax=Nitratireductor aquibiodomus RA22 TaxID=1189611 RepID=I5C5B7_9HYPH|nr:hypothetical protein A33O_04120 [Nitratireductor aquibiodomus RA22]
MPWPLATRRPLRRRAIRLQKRAASQCSQRRQHDRPVSGIIFGLACLIVPHCARLDLAAMNVDQKITKSHWIMLCSIGERRMNDPLTLIFF